MSCARMHGVQMQSLIHQPLAHYVDFNLGTLGGATSLHLSRESESVHLKSS